MPPSPFSFHHAYSNLFSIQLIPFIAVIESNRVTYLKSLRWRETDLTDRWLHLPPDHVTPRLPAHTASPGCPTTAASPARRSTRPPRCPSTPMSSLSVSVRESSPTVDDVMGIYGDVGWTGQSPTGLWLLLQKLMQCFRMSLVLASPMPGRDYHVDWSTPAEHIIRWWAGALCGQCRKNDDWRMVQYICAMPLVFWWDKHVGLITSESIEHFVLINWI